MSDFHGDFFKCPDLRHLYSSGKLDHVIKQFGNLINNQTLIANGGDASVFDYHNGESVLKLVPKTIRFFQHFGNKGPTSANEFQKYINHLDPFFLPVDEILYEDDNVFIYTQRKCQLLNTKTINTGVVIDVFRLIQFMLLSDILLTDLAPHNLGIYKDHVLVFDYHGLHRLKKNGQIKRTNWWRRLARNLTRFICCIYVPDRRKEFAQLMQNCNSNTIAKFENEPQMPISFVELLKYLSNQQNRVIIDQVYEYLELCIHDLIQHENNSHESANSSYSHRHQTQKTNNKHKIKSHIQIHRDDSESDSDDQNKYNHKMSRSKIRK